MRSDVREQGNIAKFPGESPFFPGLDGFAAFLRVIDSVIEHAKLHVLPQGHPAIADRDVCNQLIEHGEVQIPRDAALMPHAGRILLDAMTLSLASGNSASTPILGDFTQYGDERKRDMILQHLATRAHYGDMLSELSFAGWHLMRGHSVSGFEIGKYPDIRVHTDQSELPIYAECKRIRSVTPARIIKEIRAANESLKRVTEPCFGVAYLHLTLPQLWTPRPGPDTIHPSIRNIVNVTGRAMSGPKNRSVGIAVLSWDEYSYLNSDTESIVRFRRPTVLVHHQPHAGVVDVPPETPVYEGFVIDLSLHRLVD